MTLEISGKDRTSEMLTFFVEDGIESIRLFLGLAREKFNITPAEFYGMMISLLESLMKRYTNKDALILKKIFNDKKRQKLVDFFDEAFLEFYSEQIN